MIDATFLAAVLDSLKDPILVADTEHVTRYMNKAAKSFYTDGEKQIGRSLLDCHNEQSQQMMIEILAVMHEGEDERIITNNEEHRIYMRVVRGTDGQVLGYYERYEPPEPATG
jgi:nitrogen-specific signal transduction histidine kinase